MAVSEKSFREKLLSSIRGYQVARGPVATIEIGIEVKILAKAMIKQIDRVAGDLTKQVAQFKHRSGACEPICVGVVGINAADVTTGYEGDRSYRTDGSKSSTRFRKHRRRNADYGPMQPPPTMSSWSCGTRPPTNLPTLSSGSTTRTPCRNMAQF